MLSGLAIGVLMGAFPVGFPLALPFILDHLAEVFTWGRIEIDILAGESSLIHLACIFINDTHL